MFSRLLRLLLPILAGFVLSLLATAYAHGQPRDRFNLPDKPEKPRFELTGIAWPAKVGEAAVCLWHDDKLAALSITIDDNSAPDIPWWREKAAAHGFRATWFVITDRISGSNRIWGTWEQYQQLLDEGHGIESHTMQHLHTDKGPAGGQWSIEWEYAESLKLLHQNLKGPRSATLAYPGGPNSKLNDRALAARLYRAARGGSGFPNPANRIDYFAINGMSGFHVGDRAPDLKPAPWADLRNLVDPSLYQGRAHRGWAVVLAHLVNEKARPGWENLFVFIDANREKLWVGLFTDVAKYGQQRDTATLSVTENSPERIQFLITDEMDDAYFDHPLSVKLRVPDAWAAVSAMQNGKPLIVRRLVHEGAVYAIVQAVPDRGRVTVSPAR